ncbi:hypothetical protein BCR37DRAFT_222124 [Protomyces lactucae-debilis]|uniref:C2H2-type domain-containing protein n=1 Tax=Protomyces lactucae-debilis TaxID=2754530 RepID=A0A1Y2ERZ8_PROLT|nr:uncharacterized protein BCR37DRAFT_222124 [Protomyces lactucae-debilis]ORY74338.1 hypothetical protein BCR37DRAFT_222124 [Protomyces lactucae-debilis]
MLTLLTLTDEPIKIFTCDQCPKTFVRSDLLYRHKDRHVRKQNKLGATASKDASDKPISRRASAGGAVRSNTFKTIRPARSESTSSRDDSFLASSPQSQPAQSPPSAVTIPQASGLLQSPFGRLFSDASSHSHGHSHSLPLPLPSFSLSTAACLAAHQSSEYTSQERYRYLPGIGQARSTGTRSPPPAAPSSTTSLTSSESAMDSPRMPSSSFTREISLLNHPLTNDSMRFGGPGAFLPPIRDLAPLQGLSKPAYEPRMSFSMEGMLNSGVSSHLMSDLRRFKQDSIANV